MSDSSKMTPPDPAAAAVEQIVQMIEGLIESYTLEEPPLKVMSVEANVMGLRKLIADIRVRFPEPAGVEELQDVVKLEVGDTFIYPVEVEVIGHADGDAQGDVHLHTLGDESIPNGLIDGFDYLNFYTRVSLAQRAKAAALSPDEDKKWAELLAAADRQQKMERRFKELSGYDPFVGIDHEFIKENNQ